MRPRQLETSFLKDGLEFRGHRIKLAKEDPHSLFPKLEAEYGESRISRRGKIDLMNGPGISHRIFAAIEGSLLRFDFKKETPLFLTLEVSKEAVPKDTKASGWVPIDWQGLRDLDQRFSWDFPYWQVRVAMFSLVNQKEEEE